MDDVRAIAESVFREESGRIIATLIRLTGSFDIAEEAMQEAFASALATWPEKGVPEKPGAWITTVAHRRIIDHVRREQTRREKQDPLLDEPVLFARAKSQQDPDDMTYPDDRLRLIFTCCHPALNQEAQVALTLRTLGGLTTPENPRAFLLPQPTLAHRLARPTRTSHAPPIPHH